MSDAGLSGKRLHRMHEVMAGHVERGYVPGVVTVVSRRGEVHVDAVGSMALGGAEPMRRDTIFRLWSVTKLVVAVATMILVEQCRLRLDDPVDPLLPELADRRVLRTLDSPLGDTVPAHRPITVRDLLSFRLGWGNIFAAGGATYPIQQAINDLGIPGFGRPMTQVALTPDEWLARLATLPLLDQPGEVWRYNTGSSILGVLISRVSGQPLEDFLRDQIFEPLGMKDTSFSVPADKLDRLATAYTAPPGSLNLELTDGVKDGDHARPPAFPDGAAGLVSTADDLLAFGRMLLNNGRYGTERLLSRPAVQLMTTDQLTARQRSNIEFFPGFFDSRGWGLGFCVTTGRTDLAGTPGRFGWDGGAGTSLWCDPAEDLIGIMLTQRAGFPLLLDTYVDFWSSVYQAIDD